MKNKSVMLKLAIVFAMFFLTMNFSFGQELMMEVMVEGTITHLSEDGNQAQAEVIMKYADGAGENGLGDEIAMKPGEPKKGGMDHFRPLPGGGPWFRLNLSNVNTNPESPVMVGDFFVGNGIILEDGSILMSRYTAMGGGIRRWKVN